MAVSKCVCGRSSFELVTAEPSGSRVKLNFIQCSSCGVVIGVTDYFSVGGMVSNLTGDIKKLSEEVSSLNSQVHALRAALHQRR